MFCSVQYAPQRIKGKREDAFFWRGGGGGWGTVKFGHYNPVSKPSLYKPEC